MFKFYVRAFFVMLFINIGNFHYVDPGLQDYDRELQIILETKCSPNKVFKYKSTIIEFGDVNEKNEFAIAYCKRGEESFTIVIDKTYWKWSNRQERYETFMHEAGHCYLHAPHVDDKKNFMYYEENGLSEEVVREQFIKLCR